jgi:hypothetical protein
MRSKWYGVVIGVMILSAALGCGLTDTILSNTVGGSKGNTVAALWPDVPAIPGAQRQTMDLPLPVQLAIQGMMKASASSSDAKLDKFDWIVFTTTQTPQNILSFYTNERMSSQGWNVKDQPGCTGAKAEGGLAGGVCIFGKGSANGQQSVLFIVPGQDDKTKQTQVFYVRIDGVFDTKTK